MFLVCLAQKLELYYHLTEVNETVPIAEKEERPSKELSLADRLQKALKDCNEASHLSTQCATLENAIGKELEFMRTIGQRGKILNALYNALLCIPATSVEAERAFSASGLFLTKLRSRLNDETLCKLTMLRYYFQHL